MQLFIDTREQHPLVFPAHVNVEVSTVTLQVGDYHACHPDGPDTSIVERKSIADLFSSFTSGYDREKAKWQRAQTAGLHYILAIEGTVSEVLKGHQYRKGGEWHESKKNGLSMLKQVMTVSRKYNVSVWFCASRSDMAWQILHYYLAFERIHPEAE